MVINLETAVEFLKTRDNFLILTHSHPDGDTLGSAFALKYALEAVGKRANVKCNDTVAKKFDYLGKVCEDECAFDALVAVDVADTKLLGKDFEEKFADRIELWFRESLSSQPQAADTIIAFVNSYLVHTKSGVFFGVGLVFMLFTVLMLTANVEKTFNSIWQVKHPRSVYRAVTDYLAMLFLVPIVIVVTSGVSIVVATLAGQTNNYIVLGSVMRVTVDVLPYVLMSVVFMGLYLFMPNTKVRFSVVVIPGILAGIAMQVLQLFYIHAQIFLSSYNAIYGSFAALPLFMLWVQISWTICLFGVELCYTNQNMDELSFMTYTSKISHRYKLLLSVTLMSHICHRFAEGRKPYTALDLKMMTDIPIRITQDLLYNLVSVGLMSENSAEGKDAEPTYQPALSLEHITIGSIVERLDSLGEWHLDIDVRKQLENVSWREYMRERKAYLDNLRKIGIV